VEKETPDSVTLNVGFGTVKFRRGEIKDILVSTPDQRAAMLKEWEVNRKQEESKWQKKTEYRKETARQKEFAPKHAGFSGANDQITVNAVLNKKIKANLLLDTGATLVLLSKKVADKIKKETNLTEGDIIKMQLADGRKTDARLILLDTLSVEDATAENIIGAVLLDPEEDIGDGVLGMSFLSKFNFQIDNAEKKIILKKLEKEIKKKETP